MRPLKKRITCYNCGGMVYGHVCRKCFSVYDPETGKTLPDPPERAGIAQDDWEGIGNVPNILTINSPI